MYEKAHVSRHPAKYGQSRRLSLERLVEILISQKPTRRYAGWAVLMVLSAPAPEQNHSHYYDPEGQRSRLSFRDGGNGDRIQLKVVTLTCIPV